MERVAEPLRRMGAAVETTDGHAPRRRSRAASCSGIRYELPVASAQVKSASCSRGCYAEGPTTVVEPVPTRDHTELMLAAAGAPRHEAPGTRLRRPAERLRLGSTSSARATSRRPRRSSSRRRSLPGSELTIHGVNVNPTRTGLLDVLERMGARIGVFDRRAAGGEPSADLEVQSAELTATAVARRGGAGLVDELPLFALRGLDGARRERGLTAPRSCA